MYGMLGYYGNNVDKFTGKSINKKVIFDYQRVLILIKKNKKGTIDTSYPIWSLLVIESWMRQFSDNKSKDN